MHRPLQISHKSEVIHCFMRLNFRLSFSRWKLVRIRGVTRNHLNQALSKLSFNLSVTRISATTASHKKGVKKLHSKFPKSLNRKYKSKISQWLRDFKIYFYLSGQNLYLSQWYLFFGNFIPFEHVFVLIGLGKFE